MYPRLEVIAATVPPAERERLLDARSVDAARNPLVQAVARALYGTLVRSLGRTPSRLEVVQWLMDSIHLLVEYVGDPPGEEVFQSVEYTLTNELGREVSPLTGRRKGTADCEDLSAAVVALGLALVALGLTPGLTLRNRWWNQPGAVQNHVAGEACDPTFVHEPCISVETTIPGALAGDDPYQALFRVGGDFRTRVFGADQIPYLTLT